MEGPIALHKKYRGKICVRSKVSLNSKEALSWAYTPGVAEVSNAIAEQKELSFEATWRANSVAVLSDGSRVLGLGDIGPEAALPVMEGKAALFKEFGNVDAVPLCVNVHTEELLREMVFAVSTNFGGINLEDIRTSVVIPLYDSLNGDVPIPVFHDDRHGTGVVTVGALLNALKVVGKGKDASIVVVGAGSAAVGIVEILHASGFKNIRVFDSKGEITSQRPDIPQNYKRVFLPYVGNDPLPLEKALDGADVLIAASVPGSVEESWLKNMASDAVIFTLANPTPEIDPEVSKKHARIVATGRSDLPNQVNNVLAFPGIFRGLLDVRAKKVSLEMMVAAAEALANSIEPTENAIVPNPFNKDVVKNIAVAMAHKAIEQGLAGASISKDEASRMIEENLTFKS